MHLIYLDESGNSGLNLADPAQPVFALCAMVVPEDRWQSLERELQSVLNARFPLWRAIPNFEIHGHELRRGDGPFKELSVKDRIAFRDEWMSVGEKHGVRLIARSILKKAYLNWLTREFGSGIRVNPHVAAFALVSRCIDNYLQTLKPSPLGILISDENKETVGDIEKSISVLRWMEGTLKLSRIVEKGFFIDSSKSLPLQLCDLFTLSYRKQAERVHNCGPAKPIDDSGIAFSERLLHNDNQHDGDVIAWLATHVEAQKKVAARG